MPKAPRSIVILPTDVERRLLQQLLDTGLWGFTLEDVCERLIAESLRQKISPKQIVLRMRDGADQKRKYGPWSRNPKAIAATKAIRAGKARRINVTRKR